MELRVSLGCFLELMKAAKEGEDVVIKPLIADDNGERITLKLNKEDIKGVEQDVMPHLHDWAEIKFDSVGHDVIREEFECSCGAEMTRTTIANRTTGTNSIEEHILP